MRINMPEKVKFIINNLIENGYEAYAVGGCIRDALLQKEPKDWDITTSATPQQVKEIFGYTIDTGLQHGTITIMLDKEGFEVTTYRVDGDYEDNRRPVQVEFTASLIEDLKRRDFTINAMAYNEVDGLVDEFDGIEDLNNKIIRCVGDPIDRFSEDALRILRAVRFSAQLGFKIHEDTEEAIKMKVNNLEKISAERIQSELTKILISDKPETIEYAYKVGITKVVLNELDIAMKTGQNNPHHIYTVGKHLILSTKFVPNNSILRWTMLLHDIAKPNTKTTDSQGIDHFYGHQQVGEKMAVHILKRLKFDNYTIDTVSKLVRVHDDRFDITKRNVRRAMNRIGIELFPLFLMVQKADMMAQNPENLKEKSDKLEQIETLYQEIITDNECVTLKDLEINGEDIKSIGVLQGKQIGKILNILLEDVMNNPKHNNRQYLLNKVREELG